MSQQDLEKARRLVALALEVLSGLGLPGAGVAKTAVGETARRLAEREREERLARALRQAEEDFRTQARARGWHGAADLVCQLPMHDAPSFREALRAALEGGRSELLAQTLERSLASHPISPPERADAALLYARCVWARLWAEADFRDAVRDVLFRDHAQLLESVSARLDQLTETLPRRVVDEQERRRRKQAWDALGPAVLPRPELTPANLLESLRAPYRLVDFTGTGPGRLVGEIAASFQNLSPAENRAWLLWGPGGVGKTRTAVEVARKLEENGWRAGFVPRAGEVPEWQENLRIWTRPEAPTLLIVDYAEQRPSDELEALARAVRASSPERAHPLALLFLMRANPQDAVAGHVAGALREAGVRYEARAVPTLAEPADRAALFRRARRFFRASIAPPDAPPEVEYAPEALPTAPLALLALAVLAACGHAASGSPRGGHAASGSPRGGDRVARSGDEVAVLTDLWERWEGARWKRTLLAQGGAGLLETPEVWEEARERIEGALAAATLGRPFAAPEEVADWWRAHFPFRACTARGERVAPGWLARRLQSLFPAPEGEAWRLPPIVPDPLADVVLACRGAGLGPLAASILPGPEETLRAYETARRLAEEAEGPMVWPVRMVLELLPRASDAAIPGAREAADAALGATARWLKETAKALPPEVAEGWLRFWEGALPDPDRTLALRPFLAEFYRVRLERTPPEAAEERARLLNNLGWALSALGRREEALAATQEAVKIYRELAAANPQAFLPELAMSLNNLGGMLSALGRREEALKATQEAVEIRRKLAAANPPAFLPDLAMSLTGLGVVLSNLGRREEALAATKEAVEIYRELAAASPQAFLPGLAMSLNNLGSDLSALGRREEALAATQEAVEIRRELAAANPQAFLPELAMSLNNLGRDLSALGRREEALAATQEAVEIRRQLAAANPQAFLPDLAMSLNNLGYMLSALGRREEALKATQEAVEIRRKLAAANPPAFLPDLATSLNNLGYMLSALGRREEALSATQEAVEHYRQLATANPQTFLPDLATSLNNLGSDLSALGRWEEALRATQEAVEIRRELAAANPPAFLPDLAASLNNLGYMLSALGRWEEALRATQEAVEIRRELAAANPPAFLPDLAASLNNLGNVLSALGRREEALRATQEAVGIYRELAAANPPAFLPDLARSLGMQGSVLLEAGRAQEARAAFAEGLRAILPFARALPAAFGELAAALLQYYLRACGEAGEEPEAGLVEEASRLLGRPAAVHPAVAGLAPLLLAVVGLARGEAGPEVARAVEGTLAQMREHPDWRALAEALGRLAAGERDPQALRQGLALDPVDEQALSLAERAVGEEAAREVLAARARGAGSAD